MLTEARYANGSRTTYSYNTSGQPHLISSSDGYAIVIDYSGGNISTVCGYNRALTVVTAASDCTGATVKTSYGYNTAGTLLTSVTHNDGATTAAVTIDYVGTSADGVYLPSCISLPNSGTCEIANVYGEDPNGTGFQPKPDQVRRQTTAGGGVWTYSYEPEENANDVPPVLGEPRIAYADMIDSGGRETYLTYDRGRLINIVDPSGTTNYKYPYRKITVASQINYSTIDQEFHGVVPDLITPPGGRREYFEHDLRGNITSHSYWPVGSADPLLPDGSPAISPNNDLKTLCCISPTKPVFPSGSLTYSQTFLPSYGAIGVYGGVYALGCGQGPQDAKLCNKPLSKTDPMGRQTDYTYDPVHGGVLTETAPAVSNDIRPQTRYFYTARYAWVKNASGTYVQEAAPVWLLTSKSICKAGAALGNGCQLGASDEVVTSYDYGPDSGPNNLLLRGVVADANGAALRSCYAYDWQGNKISETKPRAGLTSCP